MAITVEQISTTQYATRRSGPSANVSVPLSVNESNELLVAQGLPPYAEMTRRFDLFSTMNTSALAALVVRPSTTSNFTIFNNESAGSGKIYVMHRIWAFNLVSTAAQARQGMWYCVHSSAVATPTNDITARSSGRGDLVSSKSIADTATTVPDDGWFPIGPFSDVEVTGVLPGAVMSEKFDGTAIIPPGKAISGQVVSSVTGNTFTMGFSWWEVPASFFTLTNG